jgi:hypothetical protein
VQPAHLVARLDGEPIHHTRLPHVEVLQDALRAVDDRWHKHDLHDDARREDAVQHAVVVVHRLLIRLGRHADLCVGRMQRL